MSEQVKIELRDVGKSFGAKKVLQGVNLKVHRGESVVVIGGSGSGKSVMLKSILGLMEPDTGQIFLDGEDTTHLRGRAREAQMEKFGMLFQGGALFDSLKVWENITFRVATAQKLTKAQAKELAAEKLRQVGLKEDNLYLFPAELSGGMQKRVALARAIAANPEIIFFDEPTTGLDPIMADVINELIIQCSRELNLTTLTITHDMHSAQRIAHRVAMLYQGKLIWQGNAKDIYESGNEYVDQFVHGRAHGPVTDGKAAA
jgi:phospholipid/cholesterol/gamma-HCH transport system ATP-binding protein